MNNANNFSSNQFQHKKIGIWGFGVVGQSALTYFDQQNAAHIQILNNTEIILPTTKTPIITTVQNKQAIQNFLEHNDIILVSPGIPLHDYQQFAHKFIAELDLYQQHCTWQTIAITGSLGKTSITHLLTTILQKNNTQAIAAGNIGYPMLSLLTESKRNKNHDTAAPAEAVSLGWAVLELSSFQLQQAQTFAPDIAIITNIYPNHLDHHKNMQEYQESKANIFKYQSDDQQALLPLDIVDAISKKFAIKKNWVFFNPIQPTDLELKKYAEHAIYYLAGTIIYRTQHKQTEQIFDISTLPTLTFATNWLVIIATCNLYKINLATIATIAKDLTLPDHRVQKVGSHNESNFYNDSKSTVWQATLQAVNTMANKPIKLFLGGLSKGADRTPLLQALADKNIEIYTFGKEAEHLAQLCEQFNIKHSAHATLDSAWQSCTESLSSPHEVLFSPAGSSFDLFVDYKTRGKYFTKLVENYCKTEQK